MKPGKDIKDDEVMSVISEVLVPCDETHSETLAASRPERRPCVLFLARMSIPPQQLAESAAERSVFAGAPLPQNVGSLKARVIRTHRGIFAGDRFSLYAELEGGQLAFIVAAEKQVAQRPYFLLSSHNYEFDHNSEHFQGRLMGNTLCTQYVLHGRRRQSSKRWSRSSGSDKKEPPREELAVVRFRKPGDAPRTMEVAIPSIAADGARCQSRPKHPRREGLQCAWKWDPGELEASEVAGLSDSDDSGPAPASPPTGEGRWCRLVSPLPRWDEERQIYTMDFHGRVKRSSSKNFQLTPASKDFKQLPGADGDLVMQFGRVDEDVFSLDVTHPLSPTQALALALSTFDSRLVERFRLYY